MKKLQILYEDKELLIVNKPAKQLTISTAKIKENTLYNEVSAYVKKQYPKNKVFIVNRLDKDTSGIVVFAKNEQLKEYLQKHWGEVAEKREYIAIVEGKVNNPKERLTLYLEEDKYLKVHVSDKKRGKKSITEYEVLEKTNAYSLLKINILTGRKHQIRVSLTTIGHPITGDKKYAAKKNPLGRLALHANKLILKVPSKSDSLVIESPIPKEFLKIFHSSKKEEES